MHQVQQMMQQQMTEQDIKQLQQQLGMPIVYQASADIMPGMTAKDGPAKEPAAKETAAAKKKREAQEAEQTEEPPAKKKETAAAKKKREEALKPRLCFWEPKGRLPEDLSIKIFREAGVEARSQAAQVCNVFNDVISSGRVRGAFDVKDGSIAAGVFTCGRGFSVICTSEGRVLTFGNAGCGNQLGHDGDAISYQNEKLPRIVEGLVGVKVAQVAAGSGHTVICSAEGCVWTFGSMINLSTGMLRMVKGLVGVKVVQVAAGYAHTVICSTEGRVWTFGWGHYGQLGHGGQADEKLPRMVEGLVGVKADQVAAGNDYT